MIPTYEETGAHWAPVSDRIARHVDAAMERLTGRPTEPREEETPAE